MLGAYKESHYASQETEDYYKIEEKRDYPVYKENELVRMCYDLSTMDQRVFSFIISKLDPNRPKDRYSIDIKEYMEVVGIDTKNGKNYINVKNSIKSLADKSVWVEITNGKQRGEKLVRCLENVEIYKQSGIIKFSLGEAVTPYLFNLNHFIKYSLRYILGFKRRYSIHLYEILKSYQYRGTVQIPLDDLRNSLLKGREGLKSGYERYSDFSKRILKPSIGEINELSDIIVDFEAKSDHSGNKFDTLTFNIRQKNTQEILHVHALLEEMMNADLGKGQAPGQLSLLDFVEQPQDVREGEVKEGLLDEEAQSVYG